MAERAPNSSGTAPRSLCEALWGIWRRTITRSSAPPAWREAERLDVAATARAESAVMSHEDQPAFAVWIAVSCCR